MATVVQGLNGRSSTLSNQLQISLQTSKVMHVYIAELMV